MEQHRSDVQETHFTLTYTNITLKSNGFQVQLYFHVRPHDSRTDRRLLSVGCGLCRSNVSLPEMVLQLILYGYNRCRREPSTVPQRPNSRF